MYTKLAFLALVIVLVTTASSGASAALFGADVAGVSFPVYTEQTSYQTATGKVQATVTYCDKVRWQWDEAESAYPGTYAAGIGAEMKVYPNILANLPIAAVAAVEGELERPLEFHKEKGVWCSKSPGVKMLPREGASGRFFLNIPLDASVGSDTHCVRFYGLEEDAKRTDHKVNLVLFKIKWASKSSVTAMADTFRFKTELWPAGCEKPSGEYFTDLHRRAGNGGNGLVFETLIANDRTRQTAGQTTSTTVTMITGDYILRVVKNGQAYTGRYWVKKFDTAHPEGVLGGPFIGDLAMRNADLGASVNGVVTSVDYTFAYSTDNTNWKTLKVFPTAGAVIELPL